jgi:hypothetical protein
MTVCVGCVMICHEARAPSRRPMQRDYPRAAPCSAIPIAPLREARYLSRHSRRRAALNFPGPERPAPKSMRPIDFRSGAFFCCNSDCAQCRAFDCEYSLRKCVGQIEFRFSKCSRVRASNQLNTAEHRAPDPCLLRPRLIGDMSPLKKLSSHAKPPSCKGKSVTVQPASLRALFAKQSQSRSGGDCFVPAQKLAGETCQVGALRTRKNRRYDAPT